MRNKIENFLRSETFLHFAFMFFLQVMIIQIMLLVFKVYLPLWFCAIIPIFAGISKELFDKHEGKYISYSDIAGTIVGGFLAILILRIEL